MNLATLHHADRMHTRLIGCRCRPRSTAPVALRAAALSGAGNCSSRRLVADMLVCTRGHKAFCWWCLGLAVLLLSVPVEGSPRGLSSSAAHTSSSRSTGQQLRHQLRTEIAQQLNGPHFETWLDPNRFARDRLVMQARRLWYYSTLLSPYAMGTEGFSGTAVTAAGGGAKPRQGKGGQHIPVAGFSPLRMEKLRAAAEVAFQDLKMFRLDNGGWRFSFESTIDPQIHMYGVDFALFGLSTYYHATGNTEARDLANATFEAIRARLLKDGGVFPEGYELDYKKLLFTATSQNVLGNYKERRTVNTHIHLIEALTAYHALVAKKSSDVALMQRSVVALEKATKLVMAMKAGPRMIELRSAADATRLAQNPALRPDEPLMFLPGHQVEATFLVQDAFDVLGKADRKTEAFTKEILEESERWMQTTAGFRWMPHILVSDRSDSRTAASPSAAGWAIGKSPWQAEVNWWTQLELLNALVHADKRYGGPYTAAGDKYIQRAAKTWELISQRFVNKTSGALHETLDRQTMNGDGIREFGPWKVCYHTTRALVRSLQALSPGISAPGGDATAVHVTAPGKVAATRE